MLNLVYTFIHSFTFKYLYVQGTVLGLRIQEIHPIKGSQVSVYKPVNKVISDCNKTEGDNRKCEGE